MIVNHDELLQLIIEHLGLRELNTEKQGVIIARLEKLILSRLNLAVLEKLTESEQEELLRLADSGDTNAVEQYVRAKVANFDELLRQTAITTIEEFKRLRG